MEEQNAQANNGIDLADVFRLLLRKIKYLILALLVGGILGCGLAVLRTKNVDYYGTTIEFYVNPRKADSVTSTDGQYGSYNVTVMDTMVTVLNSQSFAEKMLLNGKQLPEIGKWTSESDPDEVKNTLDALIVAATPSVEEYETALAALNAAKVEQSRQEMLATQALVNINNEWVLLYTAGKVKSSSYDKTEYDALNALNPASITQTLKDGVSAYNTASTEVEALKAQVTSYNDDCVAKKAAASEGTQAVMAVWRQTAKYQAELSKYQRALSFSYKTNDATATVARSFIYARISVLRDEKFANELLERIQAVVPSYIDENLWHPAGYIGTNCTPTATVIAVGLTNPDYTVNTAIKYGLLLAALAFVIACVAIIMIDRTDRRLRDPDDVKRIFDVPVLGIVPTIEGLAPSAVQSIRIDQNDSDKE